MNYSSIKAITIPKSVEKIGAGCFIECPNLKETDFPDNVTIESSPIGG